jgi:undecaprenyl phosphate N,N'-diacetylbacillosamine 1-phosphate transferase
MAGRRRPRGRDAKTTVSNPEGNCTWSQPSACCYRPLKRLADVVAATVVLIMLSPVLLLAALAVKLTSRGPVFFTQTRIGLNQVPFRVWKYRTMHGDRKPDPKELVPLDHPEITPVGRLLRRLKIDELPQLVNVLIGEMSIVGPRPTLPDQVERYDVFERQRQWVRPGCTGLAQIHGGTAITWPDRIRWDVYYVHHMSPWLDLQILFRTPLVILLGESRFVCLLGEGPEVPVEKTPQG